VPKCSALRRSCTAMSASWELSASCVCSDVARKAGGSPGSRFALASFFGAGLKDDGKSVSGSSCGVGVGSSGSRGEVAPGIRVAGFGACTPGVDAGATGAGSVGIGSVDNIDGRGVVLARSKASRYKFCQSSLMIRGATNAHAEHLEQSVQACLV